MKFSVSGGVNFLYHFCIPFNLRLDWNFHQVIIEEKKTILINCVTIYIKLFKIYIPVNCCIYIYISNYIKQEVGVGDDNSKDGPSQTVMWWK